MNFANSPFALYIAIGLVVPTVGDLVTHRSWLNRTFGWGIFDGLQHGAVGLAVTLPILLHLPGFGPWALVFAAATLVDIDHLVCFPGWWPVSELDAGHRRHIHTLLTALIVGSVAGIAGGNILWAWLGFAAVISHLLRDTTMGTVPLLCPLRFSLRLNRPLYYGGELVLCAISYLLAAAVR